MKSTLNALAALLLTSWLVSGCGTQHAATGPGTPRGSGGSAADQALVSQQLAQNPDFVDDGNLSEAGDPMDWNLATASGVESSAPVAAADSQRVRFWRRITESHRTFEFTFSDTDSTGRPTLATVTVNKALTGTFNVQTVTRRDSTRVRSLVQKPLKDFWVRRLLLKREREHGESDEPEWRIAAVSGVKVTSRDAATKIQSIQVTATGFDATVTDPLAFLRMGRVLRFDPNDSVTVKVTTLRNDDVVVLQRHDGRLAFRNTGNNTYTAVFRVRFLRRIHHLGVNALSHGSLFDSQARYDSQAWILPYVVRPTELADARP